MSNAPTELFLDIYCDDEKIWKILDENKNIIGEGEQPEDAIAEARKTSNIDITTLSGYIVTQNVPEGVISEYDILETLAELAGMKLTKYLNDDFTTAGYTMELIE